MGITKPCTQLHPASFNLYLAPSISTRLISVSTQLSATQNIARNWAISQNLEQKIQCCPFWLKTDTHGVLQMLIPNLDFNFSNSDSKIHFLANFGRESKSCLFCLKIGTYGILRMLILILTLVFWFSKPRFIFGHSKWKGLQDPFHPGSGIVCFAWCSYTSCLEGGDLFYLKSATEEANKESL